jgi:hypothetical protein
MTTSGFAATIFSGAMVPKVPGMRPEPRLRPPASSTMRPKFSRPNDMQQSSE